MNGFRILLVILFVWVVGYTVPVIAEHGLSLFAVFFGDMAKLGWAGQFNADFLCFLVLSGTWLAWRNNFSPAGLALGVGGFFLGAPFLAAYLFFVSRQVDGDWAALLLGPERARA